MNLEHLAIKESNLILCPGKGVKKDGQEVAVFLDRAGGFIGNKIWRLTPENSDKTYQSK